MKETDLRLYEAASHLARVRQPLPPLSGETREALGNTSSNRKCFLDDDSMEKQFVKIIHDKLKVHSLTGRITEELMLKAFKAVKKNRGAAGIDKVTIQMYESNLSENQLSLMKELKEGTYRPIPLRRQYIPKSDGKMRPLGIPSVRCRIAQEVVRRLINSTFENRFHENSFGFRPGRNCHQAVERVLEFAQQGNRWVVDVDIKGLLFSRYADDFVVLCKTEPDAERALEAVRIYLGQMELQVSHEKTKICHFTEGFNFLGFSIKSRGIQMRTKSKEKFQNKIREITRRSNNLDKEVIDKLNRVIRGTVNYFGTKFSTVKTEFYRLDRWIRKRIRCMKYKRIWHTDNWRLKIKLTRKMGLLSCYDLYKARLQC